MAAAVAPAPGLVAQTLEECQRSFAVHRKCIQKLKKAYADHPQELRTGVFDAVQRCLLVFKREPAVERLLQFVANLASFSNDKYASDSELAVDLLEQIIPLTKAKDKAVRFRTCQLTSKLLNSLGEDAEVSDEFYENILNAMLLRLRDKIPVVRVHAASAISRLQDPTDPEDPVTLEYLRMIANDTSKEVRKSVLANIGISTVTLPAILARIRDARDDVRKYTYNAIQIKLDMKQLTVKQRIEVLDSGLQDRCDSVRDACTRMLCEKWLAVNCKGNPVELLAALDVHTCPDQSERAIKAALTTRLTSSKGGGCIAIRSPKAWLPDASKSKVTPEGAFYWRLLARHATDINSDDLMEAAIPEILDFCAVFRSHVSDSFVASQLLRLALLLDYGDEMGRRELFTMCGSLLLRLSTPESLVPHLVSAFQTMEASHADFAAFIGESISTVVCYEPDAEYGDRPALMRSLNIAHELLVATTRLSQIAQVSDLVKSVVETGVQHPNGEIRDKAVRCLGLFCLLDEVIAGVYLPLLITVASTDLEDLRCTALSACFDLSVAFRAPSWAQCPTSLPCPEAESAPADGEIGSVFPKLFAFLSDPCSSVRALATEGFAKLLAVGRLSQGGSSVEASVLVALILTYFSPHTEDDSAARQCLAMFFPAFVRRGTANLHVLERSFLPALRHVIHAPSTSVLSKVSVLQVGQYLLSVMSSADTDPAKPIRSGPCHERSAASLLNEIVADPDDASVKHLLRILTSCNLSEAGPNALSTLYHSSRKAAEAMADGASATSMVKFSQSLRELSDAEPSDARPHASDSNDFEADRVAQLPTFSRGPLAAMFPSLDPSEEAAAEGPRAAGPRARKAPAKSASSAGGGRAAGSRGGGKKAAAEDGVEQGMLSPHSPINVRRSTRSRKVVVAKAKQDVDAVLEAQEKKEKEEWLRRREAGEDEDEEEEDEEDEEEDE